MAKTKKGIPVAFELDDEYQWQQVMLGETILSPDDLIKIKNRLTGNDNEGVYYPHDSFNIDGVDVDELRGDVRRLKNTIRDLSGEFDALQDAYGGGDALEAMAPIIKTMKSAFDDWEDSEKDSRTGYDVAWRSAKLDANQTGAGYIMVTPSGNTKRIAPEDINLAKSDGIKIQH